MTLPAIHSVILSLISIVHQIGYHHSILHVMFTPEHLFTNESIRQVASQLVVDNDFMAVIKYLRPYVFDKETFQSNQWIRPVLEYAVTSVSIDHNC
jgi:hypothetical protein